MGAQPAREPSAPAAGQPSRRAARPGIGQGQGRRREAAENLDGESAARSCQEPARDAGETLDAAAIAARSAQELAGEPAKPANRPESQERKERRQERRERRQDGGGEGSAESAPYGRAARQGAISAGRLGSRREGQARPGIGQGQGRRREAAENLDGESAARSCQEPARDAGETLDAAAIAARSAQELAGEPAKPANRPESQERKERRQERRERRQDGGGEGSAESAPYGRAARQGAISAGRLGSRREGQQGQG